MKETAEPLSPAQVASKAQAAAHRKLRQEHQAEYRAEYDRAKRELQEGR